MKDLWVAEDGTYGTSNIVLIDTSRWKDSDWEKLDDAGDWDRMEVAVEIDKKYGGDAQYA